MREAEIDFYGVPISELDLSLGAYNSLLKIGLVTIGDVLDWLDRDPNPALTLRNFDGTSLEELISKLYEKDYLRPMKNDGEPSNGGQAAV